MKEKLPMHPLHHAVAAPDKPAIIMSDSGAVTTFAELAVALNQGSHVLRRAGLKRGDVVACVMDNDGANLEFVWATQVAGLYLVPISNKLAAAEIEYILQDSGSKAVLAAVEHLPLLSGVREANPELILWTAGDPGAASDFRTLAAAMPSEPIADQSQGAQMYYSSGTTGRPKGIYRPLADMPMDAPTLATQMGERLYAMDADSIYLSPAPLYHAAPLAWALSVHKLGGTVVVMPRFDAEAALAAIERYGVTHAQFVPTHFIRMLKLPAEVRARYDHSTLVAAFHAAAPCPAWAKQAMLDWWGPVVHEYYAGSEGNGVTVIGPEEWLRKPGSVGRPMIGELRICDEGGEPVAPGTDGVIYFANGPDFQYHNAPEKAAESRNKYGWTTLGDIGHVDEDGYLFLTDRRSFMIISGGVNIYPQELENLLISHPEVEDVAVIGAPDSEMGERVVAIVQPRQWQAAGPALAEELMTFARANISRVKCPRQIDFLEELPRHSTGKLYKRLLRDRYWAEATGASG